MPEGVKVPTTTPSTRTRKSCARRLVVAALGREEGDRVGAGGQPATAWLNGAGALEEGDLGPLGGGGVAGGEAAAVGRDAGRPRRRSRGRRPGRTGRPPAPDRGRLEPAVGDRRRAGDRGQPDVVDEGGVVAAGGVEARKVIVCDPAATVKAAVA